MFTVPNFPYFALVPMVDDSGIPPLPPNVGNLWVIVLVLFLDGFLTYRNSTGPPVRRWYSLSIMWDLNEGPVW